MPTTRPRHTITETPPVQEALDGLRAQMGTQKLDFAELVMLGVRAKRWQLQWEGEAVVAAIERLAHDILEGEHDPEEVRLADEVKYFGLTPDAAERHDAAA